MNLKTEHQLKQALQHIDQSIAIADATGCDDSVAILKMAKLDLTLKLHQITESEFKAFLKVANRTYGKATKPKVPVQAESVIDAKSRFRGRKATTN